MSDFIDLTLDDEQSGDFFERPDSPVAIQEKAADIDSFGKFRESDFEYPLVKSEPIDLSDVVIVSDDNISDLRYVAIIKITEYCCMHACMHSCPCDIYIACMYYCMQ